ncbi:hypothetical protein DD238_001096 [Peronospora effusa]|uniref:Uncharacterized protein n=1 Tax=Peronospora effusa TaxID=542832 RepID=A0A3M6VRR9_9STRA|nr:hypothetical protein DD238_001096 [Peronospora effusa]RQM18393.1 hypothetical protein DD237_000859 [Peronospora effusa]
MTLSSIASAMSSKNATLAVVPLALASAGIASYARYTASHPSAEKKTNSAALKQEREEHLHQHLALAWKGTR